MLNNRYASIGKVRLRCAVEYHEGLLSVDVPCIVMSVDGTGDRRDERRSIRIQESTA